MLVTKPRHNTELPFSPHKIAMLVGILTSEFDDWHVVEEVFALQI